jgi:hypothetical protein
MSVITKEELLRIPRLRKHIKRKMQRIELYETRATGGAIEYKERVQSSVNDSASDCLSTAVDLQAEVERDINELHVLVGKAAKLADSLSDPLERDIVYAIYVRGLLWKEATDRMNYSYQRLYQKHQDILKRLEVVLLD